MGQPLVTDGETQGSTAGQLWRAVAAMFVLNGALFGVWASRIPAIKDTHAISFATLGTLLLFLAAGAICSFPLAGRWVDKWGAATITKVVACFYTLSLVTLPVAGSIQALALALFIFGALHGSMDVAMNAWGAEVERQTERPMMSSLHAMFSLGAGIGALSGYLAVTMKASLLSHFLVAGATFSVATLFFATVAWQSERAVNTQRSVFAFPKGPLLLVGLVAFCTSLGEGAMVDWSAVFLREVAQASERQAAMGYAVFSGSMVAIRLMGDRLVNALGIVLAVRISATSAFVGVLLTISIADVFAVLAGFALMGVGYAVIMPLAFSRAANDPQVSQGRAIASVATLGYGGLLLGPPVIGFLASATSLRVSFILLAILAALMFALARVLLRDTSAS